MKKPDLADAIARLRRLPKAAAADQVDRAIHQIIKALRHGHPARLPGLGTLEPGHTWTFRPEKPKPAAAAPMKAPAPAASRPSRSGGPK